jgi:aminoglycoside phosphotransferase (APT) family kinase protein
VHDLPVDFRTKGSRSKRLVQLTLKVQAALGRDIEIFAWRDGSDFWADLVLRNTTVVGVLRSPKHERLSTSYDGPVDYADVMETEVEALNLMITQEVPAPRVLAWRRRHRDEGVSWMLCEYIPHTLVANLSTAQQESLGRLAKQIHAIKPTTPLIPRHEFWAKFMLERLGKRLTGASRYCPQLPIAKIAAYAEPILLTRGAQANSLLHMDLRAANLCFSGDQIIAVIDAANALIGDPWLELGRLRAYGLLTEDFSRGYGLSGKELEYADPVINLYELETAALLMCVAKEETNDTELFETSKAQVLALTKTILDLAS